MHPPPSIPWQNKLLCLTCAEFAGFLNGVISHGWHGYLLSPSSIPQRVPASKLRPMVLSVRIREPAKHFLFCSLGHILFAHWCNGGLFYLWTDLRVCGGLVCARVPSVTNVRKTSCGKEPLCRTASSARLFPVLKDASWYLHHLYN